VTAPTIDRPTAGLGTRIAHKVAALLAENEAPVARLVGYGKGWYILSVDWERGLFEVRRSGSPISVAWGSVLEVA
jgi:hypothetical protein